MKPQTFKQKVKGRPYCPSLLYADQYEREEVVVPVRRKELFNNARLIRV